MTLASGAIFVSALLTLIAVSDQRSVFAQDTPAPVPVPGAGAAAQIAIEAGVEDGRRMLIATVTLDGEPIEGARVAFFVKRTFGLLSLGTEETLDDGTAAVLFPEDLPGGPTGVLQVVAQIVSPAEYAGAQREELMPGGLVVKPQADSFPRALWAPRAPLPLILTIAALLTGVWSTYVFVIVQLVKMKRGALE